MNPPSARSGAPACRFAESDPTDPATNCPCGLNASRLHAVVAAWVEALHPDGPHALLDRPAELGEFCAAMRALADCPALPDRAIVAAVAGASVEADLVL